MKNLSMRRRVDQSNVITNISYLSEFIIIVRVVGGEGTAQVCCSQPLSEQ